MMRGPILASVVIFGALVAGAIAYWSIPIRPIEKEPAPPKNETDYRGSRRRDEIIGGGKVKFSERRSFAGVASPPLGTWVNPNTSSSLRINLRDWLEAPNNGGPKITGQWKPFPDGSIVLTSPQKANAIFVRGGGDVLACQETEQNGALVADGVVRFQENFDWEGLRANEAPLGRTHLAYAGTWSHPNSNIKYQVKQNGDWVERRKNGGVSSQGTWKPLDDGSSMVKLNDNAQRRVFLIEDGLLGIIHIQPDGAMDGDGTLARKE